MWQVASGKHVAILRDMIRNVAEPGQTIRLAAGEYLLGDEMEYEHAEVTIFPMGIYKGDYLRQGGDVRWNRWRKGYGPLHFFKPGVKLVGVEDSDYEPKVDQTTIVSDGTPKADRIVARLKKDHEKRANKKRQTRSKQEIKQRLDNIVQHRTDYLE